MSCASHVPTGRPAPAVICPVCAAASVTYKTADPAAAFFRCSGCSLRFQQVAEQEDGSIYAEVELPRERQVRDGDPARDAERAASVSYYQRTRTSARA